LEKYEGHEWCYACAVPSGDLPAEWAEIAEILGGFTLLKSEVVHEGATARPFRDDLTAHSTDWLGGEVV
jgi:hypothetical protein